MDVVKYGYVYERVRDQHKDSISKHTARVEKQTTTQKRKKNLALNRHILNVKF